MTDRDELTARFEQQRPHLRAVAYRMLGSVGEADDAVQEAWLRLQRTDVSGVENLDGWLTTVVARITLNLLRSRQRRREEALELPMPEPLVGPPGELDPEHEVLLAESVGLALLVVLDTLTPPERVAFVLHDVFAVPFDEIAALVGRSPEATRQLASRARRRVRGAAPAPDADLTAQREVVDAFFAAGRSGDLARLVTVLDPDVVLRADFGARGADVTTGAADVAGRALLFAGSGREARPATVNGVAGAVVVVDGRPASVMAFTVVAGRVRAIDVLGDPERVARLDLGGVL
jgi:RNA polymerase sigma-70 factor (ECF subfamily)